SSPTITSLRALIILQLYGDGLEALQPCGARNIPHCGRSQETCSAAGPKSRVVRASVRDRAGAEQSAAALVRFGLICYIQRRRFGARPRGPRSFAVVAELVDALA